MLKADPATVSLPVTSLSAALIFAEARQMFDLPLHLDFGNISANSLLKETSNPARPTFMVVGCAGAGYASVLRSVSAAYLFLMTMPRITNYLVATERPAGGRFHFLVPKNDWSGQYWRSEELIQAVPEFKKTIIEDTGIVDFLSATKLVGSVSGTILGAPLGLRLDGRDGL